MARADGEITEVHKPDPKQATEEQVIEERFTEEEKADIKEIAFFLKKFKGKWDDLTIVGWAIDEFLRRKYVREKTKPKKGLRLTTKGLATTIPFTRKNIEEYLDDCIRHWRKKRAEGSVAARYYIDAFQSVRTSLFNQLLPPEK
jgi:hypothetical protein